MILYRVKDWDELYENNRSRTVKELSWVPIPNRHDGEHFSAMMAHPQGAMIYTCWVLLLQVASRCNPRGTLLRGNGAPHTAATLSTKTRAPEKWFEIALEYLTTQTDWVIGEEFVGSTSGDCQRADSVLSASCQCTDAVVTKEGKGIEGNGSEPNGKTLGAIEAPQQPQPEPPSHAQEDPEAWLQELSADPAYQGIQVAVEFRKMLNWCKVNGKHPTKRRFVNWLNRVERPIGPVSSEVDYSKGF